VDEAANQLVVAYTTKTGGGDIVYKTSSLDTISFGTTQLLIPGKVNNVTTAKVSSSGQVVFLADAKSALFTFDVAPPATTTTFMASALSSSTPSSSTSGSPPASDLAFEDPSLVEGAPFNVEGLGMIIGPSVGTTL
jgi:hypothetical protein